MLRSVKQDALGGGCPMTTRLTLVDTFGLLIAVKVVAAIVQEREGAKQISLEYEATTGQISAINPHFCRWRIFGGESDAFRHGQLRLHFRDGATLGRGKGL